MPPGRRPSAQSLDLAYNEGLIAAELREERQLRCLAAHVHADIERIRRQNQRLSGSNGEAA